jgi:cell division protein FtsB
MNPFEMVLGIILIVTIGRVLQARYGVRHGKHVTEYSVRDDAAATAENHRLKTEITDLRERIQVLERVVTDNEGSLRLDREIEKLRAPKD